MQVFLASIPLEGRAIVVVGGGDMGVAKARLASKTPATLRWFAPDLEPCALPVGVPAPERRWPEAADVANAALVFIAADDEAAVGRCAALARAAGALVNRVDQPSGSDFHTPALVDRGDIVVGIASGGAAPLLSRAIRAKVEAAIPPGAALLARLARQLRPVVKQAVADGARRRRFWEMALQGEPARLAEAGRESEARRAMLRLLNAQTPSQDEGARGVVHIVGAGPGDPELLTLKALRVLQDADVIVHDRLVPEAILDYARRDARRIYVGKRKGDHSVPQDEIESLLIDEARAGRRVVRLKGGDPFVFGRGGEELAALEQAGVETHVVPGVTAALGCAAAAGLPLTHRDHAHAVTFVTARPKAEGEPVDWSRFTDPGQTLAVYMGSDVAADVARGLLQAGRSPETPAAVVRNGGSAGQAVCKGRLAELERLVEATGPDGPAILFIGDTAALARADRTAEAMREHAA